MKAGRPAVTILTGRKLTDEASLLDLDLQGPSTLATETSVPAVTSSRWLTGPSALSGGSHAPRPDHIAAAQ